MFGAIGWPFRKARKLAAASAKNAVTNIAIA
jgi:hypothetical protein